MSPKTIANFGLVLVFLTGGAALADPETHGWYGSWSESIDGGGGSSGSASYMSNLKLTLRGSRASLANTKGDQPVATIQGRVLSRKSTRKGQILQLEFPTQRLTHTFALSTAAIADGVIVNKYRFPGSETGLDRAWGSYQARILISPDGQVVDAHWRGTIDRWRPSFKGPDRQPVARAQARALARDLAQRRPPTLRIKGSFTNKNLQMGAILPSRGR